VVACSGSDWFVTDAICGSAHVDVAIGVVAIPIRAFQGCAVATVALPDTLRYIEREAFKDSGLTSITIPNNVIRLGDAAFYGCSNLTSVSFTNFAVSGAGLDTDQGREVFGGATCDGIATEIAGVGFDSVVNPFQLSVDCSLGRLPVVNANEVVQNDPALCTVQLQYSDDVTISAEAADSEHRMVWFGDPAGLTITVNQLNYVEDLVLTEASTVTTNAVGTQPAVVGFAVAEVPGYIHKQCAGTGPVALPDTNTAGLLNVYQINNSFTDQCLQQCVDTTGCSYYTTIIDPLDQNGEPNTDRLDHCLLFSACPDSIYYSGSACNEYGPARTYHVADSTLGLPIRAAYFRETLTDQEVLGMTFTAGNQPNVSVQEDGVSISIALFRDSEPTTPAGNAVSSTLPVLTVADFDNFETTFGGATVTVVDCYTKQVPNQPESSVCNYDQSVPELCNRAQTCTTTVGKVTAVARPPDADANQVVLNLAVEAHVCAGVKSAATRIPGHSGDPNPGCMFAYWDVGDCGPLGDDFRDPCLIEPIGDYPAGHISEIVGGVGDTVTSSCCAGGIAQIVHRWRDECYGVDGRQTF